MSHTQGKWKIKDFGNREVYIKSEEKEEVICKMAVGTFPIMHNAKRIVQLNNSFDGLLESCNRAKRIMETVYNRSERGLIFLNETIAQAEERTH